jgi:hypothetical protein
MKKDILKATAILHIHQLNFSACSTASDLKSRDTILPKLENRK